MIGRPPIFDSPETMQKLIDEYFDYIKGEKGLKVEGEELDTWIREPEPITITGLCLYLGFESRQSFYDYETKEQFSYIINKARMRVENRYEKNLQGNNVAGSIFALKNMGWKDRTETELLGSIPVHWHEQKSYDPNQKTNTGS